MNAMVWQSADPCGERVKESEESGEEGKKRERRISDHGVVRGIGWRGARMTSSIPEAELDPLPNHRLGSSERRSPKVERACG